MLARLSPRLRRSFPGRVRRGVLAHRRLLAFLLTAAAVAAGIQATRPAPPESTTLTVAARDLPAGTRLTPADLVRIRVPPESVPTQAEPTPVGEVLASPLRRGEPVTDLRLVGPSLTAGHPELAAVPVRIADASSASLLRVGDTVDLYATDAATARTDLAAGDARILALPDAENASGSGERSTGAAEEFTGNGVTSSSVGRLVVVGVPPESVTTLTAAGVGGVLTFAYGP